MITTFYLPTRIIFGVGSVASLGTEARRMGKRVMLVNSFRGVQQADLLNMITRVTQDLESNGLEVINFDKVVPNPRASTVDEGAKLVHQKGVDLIIGFGGGSAMDTAKGIRVASMGNKPIWDYFEAGVVEIADPLLPLILVPTTAATGSEADSIAVLTNSETHDKKVLKSPALFANVAIIDPELTLTVPRKLTAQGGVDIFCHTVEVYITTQSPSALSDGIMETVMRLAVEALPQALKNLDDIEARTKLSWASTLAISPVVTLGGSVGVMTCHSLELPLSAYYDIDHSAGMVALLPAWMRHTFPARPERFNSLGRNVFGEADGITATEKWLDKVGMRLNLRTLGVEPQHLEDIASECAAKCAFQLGKHPNLLDAPAIAQIYRESY